MNWRFPLAAVAIIGSCAAGLLSAPAPVHHVAATAWLAGDITTYGDSRVSGTWLADPTREAWPARLAERLAGEGSTIVTNGGVGGQTVDVYADQTDPEHQSMRNLAARIAAMPVKPRVVILSSGCNDLMRVSDTGPLRWAMLHIFYDIQALGVSVFWTTIAPYGRGPVTPDGWIPALEGRRAPVDTWMHAQFGDHVIDLDPVLARSTTVTVSGTTYGPYPLMDPAYNIDGLHFNAWGAVRVSDALPLAKFGS
jgi:lysophospholipase L1-like esterase